MSLRDSAFSRQVSNSSDSWAYSECVVPHVRTPDPSPGFQESTIIFRRYTTLHAFVVTAVFAFSAVFIGISASKHTSAQAKCVTDFFPVDSRCAVVFHLSCHYAHIMDSTTSTALTGSDSEGTLLCNIFTWVGVGTMAGLWVIMAIFHVRPDFSRTNSFAL